MIDLDECLDKLYRRERLPELVIKFICSKVKEILINESNVHSVQAPVIVVGDVHGYAWAGAKASDGLKSGVVALTSEILFHRQFYDVLEIFKIGGYCPDTNYLFLGDYVDRGFYSVETISLLATLKLRFPSRITLIRGNHESRAITRVSSQWPGTA